MIVVCTECGKAAEKMFKPEDWENAINPFHKVTLKTTYQCTDKENCAYVWILSKEEIVKYFSLAMQEKGYEEAEILEVLLDKKNELTKRFKK